MQKKPVLVSPVSTQVLPVVVSAISIRPSKVILLTTPKMKAFSKLIMKALLISGIEVEERTIDPYSFSSIRKSVTNVEDPIFLLNCGTKFTAISLYRISGGKNVYYYLPDGRVVDFDGEKLLKVDDNLIDVEFHANMYGFEILEERKDYEAIRFRKNLTYYIASTSALIPTLSELFHNGYTRKIHLDRFASLALKYGVISYRGGKYRADERDYLGGKWLEEFTFLRLMELGFFDVRVGVKVRWYGEDVENEIDVMAIKRNQLHLFSCKTGRNAGEVTKHLYELEELTERIGGDFGKSYLVITENLYCPTPPNRSHFPNIPRVSFRENRFVWERYYATDEGRAYSRAYGKFKRYKSLSRRAKVLGIKVITTNDLKEGNLG